MLSQYKVTSKIGKFYIGDICYQLLDKVYDEVWGEHDYEDGLINVDGSYIDSDEDSAFTVHATADGDGCYQSDSGMWYGVDAGNLGVVPAELFKPGVEESDLGTIHEGHEMSMEVDDDFTFSFYLDGKLIETIYTGYREEDEEDEEWEDDEDST